MTEYRYFKVHPDFKGHLPANRELVGLRTGFPFRDQYDVYRYPVGTTIHISLMMNSHNTYEEARDGTYYDGAT